VLILAWLLPPLIALTGAVVLCWLAIILASRLRFIDQPGSEAHKQHAYTVPYGGGAGMALAVLAALLVSSFALPLNEGGGLPWPLLAGAGVLALLGFIDDVHPLPARLKLALQIVVCAAAVSLADLPVDFLRKVHPVLAWLAAFAWLVVVTNAYNLLDHADGLSGAVALVGCLALAGGTMLGGDASAARSWLCIAMAIGGFLVWNRPPARLYMGDSGSLAIGFLIGCGTLQTTFWPSSEGGSPLALLSPLLICAIPLFDTSAVVVKRLRRGAPIMRGDRNHISHRLTRLGVGPKASLGAVVALQVALAASSFQLRNADMIAGVVALAQAGAVCIALVLLETSRDHG
jgi:UDP-GlcNAc:undecaprenyl-phosphate/decaprenyl-phosphate GlcNAc-1-phosphate transferase